MLVKIKPANLPYVENEIEHIIYLIIEFHVWDVHIRYFSYPIPEEQRNIATQSPSQYTIPLIVV